MPKVDITVEAKEYLAFLDDLPKQFTQSVLGDMAQKAASIVRSEARRSMPIDGELGQVGKKAVIIARDRANRTMRTVTIGNGMMNLKGKPISVGKIIRHMTAGRQNPRKRKSGGRTGQVASRGGDFIQRAFLRRRQDAINAFKDLFVTIVKRRAARVTGLKYAG